MLLKDLYEDARNIVKKDPAARNIATVFLLYPGFHILIFYKIAHWFYCHKFIFIARLISQLRKTFNWYRDTSWSGNWEKTIY